MTVKQYLEKQFVEDWLNHSIYHLSKHCKENEQKIAECFVEWIKEGKPVIEWTRITKKT